MADANYTSIGLGAAPNDNTGTPARTAGGSLNTFLNPLDAALGVDDTGFLSNIQLGGTAAANSLDDYDEGSFTPTITAASGSGETYAVQVAKFTKIGNTVSFNAFIVMATLGTLSGNINMAGLPFTSSGTGNFLQAIAVGGGDNLNITAGENPGGFIRPSTTTVELKMWNNATGAISMTASELSGNGSLMISGTYKV